MKAHLLFLLVGGKVWVSSERDYTRWEQKATYDKGLINERLETAVQQCGDFLVFTIYPKKYLRFNTKTFKLEEPKLRDI